MEIVGNTLRGMYRDIIFDAQSRQVFDSGWKPNTIVVSCRVLLASFMKGELVKGISGMVVGSGIPEWDNNPCPPDQWTNIVQQLGTPMPATDISFLDDKGIKTALPSQRLEITVVLQHDFPELGKTSDLREFGLYGNSDSNMINCVRHPLIQKAATETLIRTVQLYF